MTIVTNWTNALRRRDKFKFARKGARIQKLNELLEVVQRELPSRCNATRNCLANLPDWFRELGLQDGVASLERRIGHTIPESVRLFYQFPATGCWLFVHADTNVFLDDCSLSERPHLVQWYYRPHLVIAELTHSQLVLAVELDADNPRIEWGDDGAKRPLEYPPQCFVPWLSRIAKKITDVIGGAN